LNSKLSPAWILLGQCAFTYNVLENCLRMGICPFCIAIEDTPIDNDPFKGLVIEQNYKWWEEHLFYYYGWRDAITKLCKKHNINLIIRTKVLDLIPNADILIIAGYAKKVNQGIIKHFSPWALNIHPSLLPKYRGPQPEAQAILHNENISGVSIHGMTEKLDSGPIYFQGQYKVSPFSTVGDMEKLEAKYAAEGIRSLLLLFPGLKGKLIKSSRMYFPWYKSEKILCLNEYKKVNDMKNILRLRPEGYAYYLNGACQHFPIVYSENENEGGKQKIKIGDNILSFNICVLKNEDGLQLCASHKNRL